MSKFKFTVKRSKWIRGRDTMGSYLLRADAEKLGVDDGKMCCVGFLAKACGLKKRHINGCYYISQVDLDLVPEENRPVVKWMYSGRRSESEYGESVASKAVYDTNDDDGIIDDAKREAELKKLFAKHGIEVEFKP